MKYVRWAVYAFLVASILFSARELLTVAAAAKKLAAGGSAQASSAMKVLVPPASLKAVTAALDQAGKTGALPRPEADGVEAAEQVDAPAAPVAAPAPRRPSPQPDHAEVSDTNSGAGKVFAGKGGPSHAVVPGGGVIIDADGTRLELAPPARPKPAAPSRVVLAVKAVEKAGDGAALPSLDDPKADLKTRKLRAEALLFACALGAFALALWARRWRPS